MFNRTLERARDYRRAVTIFIILLVLIIITLHNIGGLPGLSPAEIAARAHSASLRSILDNPLNAPHSLLVLAFHKLFGSAGALRLASYVYAVIFAGAFYYLARSWFGKTVGALGALVFCLSPFFLLPARVASAEIMFYWPLLLMAFYHWHNKTEKKPRAWIILLIVAGLAIYTPGMIWWIAGAAALCRKKLLASLDTLSRGVLAAGFIILIIILVPAGLAAVRDWHLLTALAAFPGHWPAPIHLLKNLGWMILSLFVKTPYHYPLFIGRLPLLDLIELALLVFGGYAIWSASRPKATAFGLSVALAVVLAAINGSIDFLLLGLPALGILMAAGLRYLYIEWRSVFPRNPIPKTLALALMVALVGVQLIYGLSYSLVAWPQSPATKSVYVLK